MDLIFNGPFSWLPDQETPFLFSSKEASSCGIYLWTMKWKQKEAICYVGETGRTFSARMYEHLKEHFAGSEDLYDPALAVKGQFVKVCSGHYGGDFSRLGIFLQKYLDHTKTILEVARSYRFYLAPMKCEHRLRQRIEAAIAISLPKKGPLYEFQEPGIRYRRRTPDEKEITVRIINPEQFHGLVSLVNA